MPRGSTLGMVSFVEKDSLSKTREALLAQLDVAMGGRAAEELVFGSSQITTGASSDFSQAMRIATKMVTQFGMSDVVGKIFYDDKYLDKLSPDFWNLINMEIKKLLDDSYERAIAILIKHRSKLNNLAEALLEEETLNVEQIKKVIKYNTKEKESPFVFHRKSLF